MSNSKTKTKPTQEELQKQVLDREIAELQKRATNGSLPKNPTRFFKVGDEVKIGALKNCTVTEVFLDGLAYRVHYDYMGESYGRPDRKVGDNTWDWTSVFPVDSFKDGEVLHEKDDCRIHYYNSSLDSLLNKVYHAGVEFNPDYQRDLVWSQEQKVNLIESIMTNVEIGKFAFIKRDYCFDGHLYEILDGKQRLTALCEYYEDRFEWRGKKFSELCFSDAYHFTGFPVSYGEVGKLTQQQIYRLFIKMNTSGTPVSQEHLNKIKQLITK